MGGRLRGNTMKQAYSLNWPNWLAKLTNGDNFWSNRWSPDNMAPQRQQMVCVMFFKRSTMTREVTQVNKWPCFVVYTPGRVWNKTKSGWITQSMSCHHSLFHVIWCATQGLDKGPIQWMLFAEKNHRGLVEKWLHCSTNNWVFGG